MTSPLLARLEALSKPDENGLLPCPVCLSPAYKLFDDEERGVVTVQCKNEGSCWFDAWGWSREDARRNWNAPRPLLALAKELLWQRDNAMSAACLMSGSALDTSIVDAAAIALLDGKATTNPAGSAGSKE